MSEEKIRVVIAEDHHVVRTAVATLLSKEPDIEVVGEASDGAVLPSVVEKYKPDLLLLDAQMPDHKPVESTKTLRQHYPDMRILVLSAHNLPEYVVGLLKAGAAGYVLKDDPSEMLLRAIRAIAQDKEWISPQVATLLVKSVRSGDESMISSLTERETEVLRLMAHGHKNSEIAQELFISEQTVKNHVSNIFSKLNVETRVEAVLYAIGEELVSVDSIKDQLHS